MLVDTGNVWNVSECLFTTCGTNVYSFGSDTIIGPHTYKKLNVNADSGFISQPHIDGAREDTSTKQVFFYRVGEYLVYDFSLNQGDTFNTLIGITPVSMIVDSVDTITLLNGENRKRIFLTGSVWSDIWIEGIGSTYGVAFMGIYYYSFDFYPELICFNQNNILKYQNPNYLNCFYNTVGVPQDSKKSEIDIYPNPFLEFSTLTFDNPFNENYTLKIIAIDGRVVSENEKISGNKIKIDRKNLKSGIYFFQLMNDVKIIGIGKLVIQ